MEKEDLSFGTKDDQLKLLRLILSASDADAEEEDIKEEIFDGVRDSRVNLYLFYRLSAILKNSFRLFVKMVI